MLLLFFCCLFLLTSFGSPTPNKKQVKKGESIILFENVNINDTVRLYINGKQNNTKIVDWTMKKTNIITATWFQFVMNNYSRIFMDPERNIWVVNADKNYEGTYSILKYPSFNVTLIILESGKKANETEEKTKCVGWGVGWVVGSCVVFCVGCHLLRGGILILILFIVRTSCWNFLKSYNPFCQSSEEKNGSEVPQPATEHNRTTAADLSVDQR